MKNLFLPAIFLLATCTLSAQIQKGSVLIGGSVGINSAHMEEADNFSLTLLPKAAFFVADKFAVGGSVSLAFSSYEILGERSSSVSFGLEPLARYYFNGAGRVRAFGQATTGFQVVKFEDSDAESGFSFGMGIGADFFLNDNVAIEGILGYDYFRYPDSDYDQGNIGLNVGIAAFLGRSAGKK